MYFSTWEVWENQFTGTTSPKAQPGQIRQDIVS